MSIRILFTSSLVLALNACVTTSFEARPGTAANPPELPQVVPPPPAPPVIIRVSTVERPSKPSSPSTRPSAAKPAKEPPPVAQPSEPETSPAPVLKARDKKTESKLKEPMAKSSSVCEARPSEVVPAKKPRSSSGSKRSTLNVAKPSASVRADRGLAVTRDELAQRRLDGSLAVRFNKKSSDCESSPSQPSLRQARVVEHR